MHSACLAQLLMGEMDLGESTSGGCHNHAVFSMQPTDVTTGQVPGAKPSPNNMPVSWYDVQDLRQVLSAKAEGIEQRTRLNVLKRTWKTTIWSEKGDEEMTFLDPEKSLVYSLPYVHPGRQNWDDELPPEIMRHINRKRGRATSMLRRSFLRNWRA